MKVRQYIFVSVAASLLAGCVDVPTTDGKARVFPAEIRFHAADGMKNRHDYQITGPTWESPHRHIGNTTFLVAPGGQVLADGQYEYALNEPAPYTSGTPVKLAFELDTDLLDEHEEAIDWQVRGVLRSQTDPGLPAIELFRSEGTVVTDGEKFPFVEVETDDLPDRVDLWTLELQWDLRAHGGSLLLEQEAVTRHTIPTLWRNPRGEAPRYKQAILWAARWGAGEWEGEEAKHDIALRMLEGIDGLGREGRSYGGFARPDRSLIEDRVDIYLDFERTACGEHRGIMMALVEYHGIDATWVWFKFRDEDETGYVEDHYDRYRTRLHTAVGREAKHWSYGDHIVVSVDGRIYDPTHITVQDSWEDYEDYMFQEYCRGGPLSDDCVPNPKGWADDGIHPRVIFAENYK